MPPAFRIPPLPPERDRLLPEAVDSPYRSWIETYASDEFQQACRDIGALMGGAIARRLGPDAASLPRRKDLEAKFEAATGLETGFRGLGRAWVLANPLSPAGLATTRGRI